MKEDSNIIFLNSVRLNNSFEYSYSLAAGEPRQVCSVAFAIQIVILAEAGNYSLPRIPNVLISS